MEGDDILGKVRVSAKYVKETAEQIHIDSDALHAFVDSLNIGTFEIAKYFLNRFVLQMNLLLYQQSRRCLSRSQVLQTKQIFGAS